MVSRLLLASGALLLVFLQAGCDTSKATEPVPVSTWLPLSVGGVSFEAQIVLSGAEQSKGLMYRESLGEDRGMLFPYNEPQPMAFWMKNTLIPLDIGFFDAEGVLREVHALHPRDTRTVRSRSDNLSYALEMNQGWFSRNRVRPGAQFNLQQLADALAARGADPETFGLPRK